MFRICTLVFLPFLDVFDGGVLCCAVLCTLYTVQKQIIILLRFNWYNDDGRQIHIHTSKVKSYVLFKIRVFRSHLILFCHDYFLRSVHFGVFVFDVSIRGKVVGCRLSTVDATRFNVKLCRCNKNKYGSKAKQAQRERERKRGNHHARQHWFSLLRLIHCLLWYYFAKGIVRSQSQLLSPSCSCIMYLFVVLCTNMQATHDRWQNDDRRDDSIWQNLYSIRRGFFFFFGNLMPFDTHRMRHITIICRTVVYIDMMIMLCHSLPFDRNHFQAMILCFSHILYGICMCRVHEIRFNRYIFIRLGHMHTRTPYTRISSHPQPSPTDKYIYIYKLWWWAMPLMSSIGI